MNAQTNYWLSPEQLAERFGLSVASIRKWRYEGTGPKGVRFGRRVRYALHEVERWEREQVAKSA